MLCLYALTVLVRVIFLLKTIPNTLIYGGMHYDNETNVQHYR